MAATFSIPLKISGYYVLPINLPPLASFPTPATHYLYLSPHEPKIATPTAPRSIFLVNVPFDATEAHIKALFSTQMELPSGRIEDLQFEGDKSKECRGSSDQSSLVIKGKKSKKRKRGAEEQSLDDVEGAQMPTTWDRELQRDRRTAVVTFVDRVSMETVIKAVKRTRKERKQLVWGEGVDEKLPTLGSARYLNHHKLRYPNKTELLNSVNTYMTAFAEKETARSRLMAKQRQEPDEDGFVTVTRGGRTGPARQEAAQEQAEKLKSKQKGLEDFYRFQTREKRKARAGELVRKFEEDKEKVRKMKERRGKFKPE